MLQAEGFRVTYVRVPLTHGVAPRTRDFDAFYGSAAAAGPNDALIYTCQLVGLPLWLGRKACRAGSIGLVCRLGACLLVCLQPPCTPPAAP